MKYTRSLLTVTLTVFFLLAGSFIGLLGRGLAAKDKEYSPDEQACIDSGLTADCSAPEEGATGTGSGLLGTGVPGGGTPAQTAPAQSRPARNKLTVHPQ